MGERNDGGSAYPRPDQHYIDGYGNDQHSYGAPGMSLRDWFAGQALSGRLINGFASSADKAVHARVSYEMADAMLEEREKAGKP